MTSPANLDHSAPFEPLAAICKACGDVLRLQILRVLRHNAYGVLELGQIFSVKQNAMSHHLKVLASAGLVTSRREGTHIFYRRAGGREAGSLANKVFQAVDRCSLPARVRQGIEEVQRERERTSQDFFRLNAEKFREQQDLIASYPHYGETIAQMLGTLADRGAVSALEVGPGEGELLADLCRHFSEITALDNSGEMLERSRHRASAENLTGIHFVHGDTRVARDQGLRADVITLNMVLHHTPSPTAVIADLANILKEGGTLVVTELCEHDQDWTRDACGDLWLGFDQDELVGWATESGLQPVDNQFLALRNGFRIQIHQFHKPSTNTNGTD